MSTWMPGEKSRRELHKKAACSFEQTLEAVSHKTATDSHLTSISQTI